ncbi:MAG TPA: TauD/TfdA family dioxygenase [Kofleriaceae bacterium]|nr:TauD/TfdA family dioxygenase [Kofleriaceae bacterium]
MTEGVPIAGPSVWTAQSFGAMADYSLRLDAAMLGDLERLHAAVARADDAPEDAEPGGLSLGSFLPLLDTTERELMTGRGFLVIRDFPTQLLDEDTVATFSGWIGANVGQLLPQNREGDWLYAVKDERSLDGDALFTSKTNLPIPWHTDAGDLAPVPDYVGLLVVRCARSGGTTQVVSVHSLYNILLTEYPDHLRRLTSPYYYHRSRPDNPDDPHFVSFPLIERFDGMVTMRYNRKRIEHGHQLAGVALTQGDIAAMDCLEAVLSRDELRIDLPLEPGDLLLLHNRLVVHARTAFTDPAEDASGRLLYRLWFARHR